MPSDDLRAWIADLDRRGELGRVRAEVDWDEEIGAITREISSRSGPGLLFENIKDHRQTACRRLFTNGTGTRERVCRILGVSEETSYRDLVGVFKERFSRPVEPRRVPGGPVKENIVRGDAVDLFQFPVPKWNPHDGGRYIMTSASVVTRDPESGVLNVGTYRGMIAGKRTIGVLLAATQGWGKHFAKYRARGLEMPVAVVIGWDQSLFIAASTPVNHPEYEMAGSLRGAPVELVQCETNDLLVPATAEIVLEGAISPDPKTYEPEGPFSEYPGYYAGRKTPKHAIRVDCVTHRDDPIFHGCLTGASPGRTNEGTTWTPATFSAMAWQYLEQAGVPNVTGVWRGKWPELLRVQIRKTHRGHAQQVAAALWGSHLGNYAGKHLIVVDHDIDIHDWEAIEWALCYRVNAAMGDITMFPGTSGSMLDPSVPLEERDSVKYGHGKWTRVLIDATINWELEPQEQYGG
ncbi:MAG TPA: UbiD family decarboxylase, partial [candidate division Zixibacteria bacterium]|nr:UbiD family decarboxylase [candidate division Zixibacteria bacterium]